MIAANTQIRRFNIKNIIAAENIYGRTITQFNESRRFMKLTKRDGLSDLPFEEADFDDGKWIDNSCGGVDFLRKAAVNCRGKSRG